MQATSSRVSGRSFPECPPFPQTLHVKCESMAWMGLSVSSFAFSWLSMRLSRWSSFAASMYVSLMVCIPLVHGWRYFLLQPWLETIFSIRAVALAMIRSRKAPPAAASIWARDVVVTPCISFVGWASHPFHDVGRPGYTPAAFPILLGLIRILTA